MIRFISTVSILYFVYLCRLYVYRFITHVLLVDVFIVISYAHCTVLSLMLLIPDPDEEQVPENLVLISGI